MSDERFEVQHRSEESRYVLMDRGESGAAPTEAGEEAYVDFDGAEQPERIFYHTHVLDAYGGQGLASHLVLQAVEHAIAEGRAIVPVCPYVGKWLKKHPEYAERVAAVRPEHLRAVSEKTQ